MINYIWMGLILIGVIVAAFTGRMEQLTEAAFDSAKLAVELAIGLIGIMALWLGLMRLAEASGLVKFIARLVRPLMVRLFPEVPADHPAMGSMIANIAANILGLGNSATALGLKAMQDLETLNKKAGTATNSMVTFLAINTTSVTLIPATVIGLRASAGSTEPTSIIGTTIIATICSTVVGVTAAKLLQKRKAYRIQEESDE
ncbi:nucleoside recognition protein [bacterium]|nr:nucleoside recognition protein [bacterium]MBU1637569.1 nucleoside recognition protein [bacterium]MBU1920992.1 nucleoside recognition protein [bacterium]RQV94614.1 MAG: nucleoside recognition protein [bacterium]